MKLFESFVCSLGVVAIGGQFEVGVVFRFRLIQLLHLLCSLGEREVGWSVIWLGFDRVFAAQVGRIEVFPVVIELGDVEVFVYTLVGGLKFLYLGQLSAGDGRFGCIWSVARV